MKDSLDDPFESPKMLVEEAFPSVDELHAACIDYMTKNQPTKLDYVDHARKLKIVGFRPSNAPPNKVRVRASRIVKDLRDALDQAAFQAAHAINPEAGINTYFPFCRDPDDFESLFGQRGRCRDIPPELRPFLKTLEPWPTGEDRAGGNDLLRALGYVAGPNKHQVTLHVTPDLSGVHIHKMKVSRGSAFGFHKHGRDMEFIRAEIDAELDYEFTAQFFVAFKSPSQFANRPAPAVLRDLARIVERIVLGIEAETARLLRERGQ